MTVLSHILGFPRIGLHRELKKTLENYWNNDITQYQLLEIGSEIRMNHWKQQKDLGIDFLPVGDFAWYDHVLTTSLMLNNIPVRHRNDINTSNDIDTLFRVARGIAPTGERASPAEMTKWFNTNYHYIVPEFVQNNQFKLGWTQLLDEVDEALILGHKIKPILLGPISYLWLGKIKNGHFDKLSLLPSILPIYQLMLQELSKRGIDWVQIDEPILVLELPLSWRKAYLDVYQQFESSVKLLLTTYFDSIQHQLDIIVKLPVHGLHVDLVDGTDDLYYLNNRLPVDWVLSAGVINGRNVWRANLYSLFKKLKFLVGNRKLWISSSCSLLHSPIDLSIEHKMNDEIKGWFSFAVQKCVELKMLSNALNNLNDDTQKNLLKNYYISNLSRSCSNKVHNVQVQEKLKNISSINENRHKPYSHRVKLQQKRFNFPCFPTTTVGSFPQTDEIRKIRLAFKSGCVDKNAYFLKIREYIKKIIVEQEKLDLDVLVHGEVERNDMVEYFGEHLNGFVFTQYGWVQSYGSRCVKPPIVIGDISRPYAMTVEWSRYAQSLTNKPVKGILTGPMTILCWSFLREDINREIIASQIALAMREEVADLELAGIGIIQIDEPALREGLPLKYSAWSKYLEWAIKLFKLTSSVVSDTVQIHTHMCYCEFNDIISSIAALDADVITIETSRSDMELLKVFQKFNYTNAIGPGVYDIHSPNIPTEESIINKLITFTKYIYMERIWVNPDCGLKTRTWLETCASLNNMVTAAKKLRKKYLNNINSNSN